MIRQPYVSSTTSNQRYLKFNGRNVTTFLRKYEILYPPGHYDNSTLCDMLCLHMTDSISEVVEELEEFEERNWEKLKKSMISTFEDEEEEEYSPHDLNQFLKKQLKKGKIRTISQLNKVYLALTKISTDLVEAEAISWQEESNTFLRLLPSSVISYLDNNRRLERYLHAEEVTKATENLKAKYQYQQSLLKITEIKSQTRQCFSDQQGDSYTTERGVGGRQKRKKSVKHNLKSAADNLHSLSDSED